MVIASDVMMLGDAMDIYTVPGSVLMTKQTVHNNVRRLYLFLVIVTN